MHIARAFRERYALDETFFQPNGDVATTDFYTAHVLAQRLNSDRHPDRQTSPAELHAIGLLHEVAHTIMAHYQTQRRPHAFTDAIAWLEERLGRMALDTTLRAIVETFPPLAVQRGEMSADEYLDATDEHGVSQREHLLEESIILWLENNNPALTRYRDLFDDRMLARQTAYEPLLAELDAFFRREPPFGPENKPLLELLALPTRLAPQSIFAQLDYIRQHWHDVLPDHIVRRILIGMDFAREEERALALRHAAPGGPRRGEAPVFHGKDAFGVELNLDEEYEAFSPDLDWMPNVVLIAKNTYVWLDQLSRWYGRSITRLDQIPDEELDKLARWGINGLWLIGLWERSPASKRIKHLCGNPDAEASAYALFDYEIAHALGGEEAYRNLRDRAWQRGIRLASDMVPNHMGIDSRWVMEHPDRFIWTDRPPFPSYTFNGPDLSWNPRIGIYLEDHYYDRTDAAVVFKWVNRETGEVRYIYHGNDGTSMPWNDTAQLDYLEAEVREAVIQQILHVARKFPIIRFDAAMTLAKRHIQRLWYPQPGQGGSIPSRAAFAMTKDEFDRLMPKEFWREVVDRVAEEAPDTLLLAEAFWLMEGYFVRTLGMHRVYNSAFMHMLRDENNAGYRKVMKETLEFDPQILKRYVNFMNNPDEETAVAQFGKGDKYFGVATMLATLPGLPMIGHGQIEGFVEKYGMEYRRAYLDESPDDSLIRRHEREIFPLFRKRRLFADVEHFLLYDFWRPDGTVDENVFAYSNRLGEERALVVYHNRYAETHGTIRSSALFAVKSDDGAKHLVSKTLADGLALPDTPNTFVIFRDHVTNLEQIHRVETLRTQGLSLHLRAYEYHVFLDFRFVQDESGHYATLTDQLQGRGVPSIAEALRELELAPVLHPFRAFLNADTVRDLLAHRAFSTEAPDIDDLLDRVRTRAEHTYTALASFANLSVSLDTALDILDTRLRHLLRLPAHWQNDAPLDSLLDDDTITWPALLLWALLSPLGTFATSEDEMPSHVISRLLDEWLLRKPIEEALHALGSDAWQSGQTMRLLDILLHHADAIAALLRVGEEDLPHEQSDAEFADLLDTLLMRLLDDPRLLEFWNVHEYDNVEWFNKEAFERTAVALTAAVDAATREEMLHAPVTMLGRLLLTAADGSGYRVRALDAAAALQAHASAERTQEETEANDEAIAPDHTDQTSATEEE
nr:alpha-amylase family glycosyl hydrolase [Ardenticatena sp.]